MTMVVFTHLLRPSSAGTPPDGVPYPLFVLRGAAAVDVLRERRG